MKRQVRRVCGVLSVLAIGSILSPACGGDSESDGSGGSSGSAGAGAGGIVDAASGGTGGTATGGTSGSGGSGGTAASGGTSGSGGSGGCNPSQCPDFQGIAPGCCRPDDTCGYDGSAIGLGCVTIDEVLGALDGGTDAGDPNCPSATVAGFTIQGCCLPTGFCGFYDPILTMSCIDPASLPPQYQPDTGPPVPCGGSGDSGSPDASTDAPTDAPPPADAGTD